ncbi:MAG TPA: DUF2752 domain-containing protein [bacterium]|nr:DUF2752 domain-containing protein [bacterium]
MNTAPPKIQPSGARAVGLILFGMALVIAATVFFFNPTTHHFYPVCQFHRLTGLDCPGCGMTRAAYALLHGDWRTALHDNALLVAVLGGLALRGGWLAVNRARGRRNGELFRAKWLWPLLVVAVVFAVLRNLPAFAFLSP